MTPPPSSLACSCACHGTIRRWLFALALLLLTGCGGSGAGGARPSSATMPDGLEGGSSVILSGKASFDFVPSVNGRLLHAETESRPIRAARVEVVDAADGAPLARAHTDESGNYSVLVPARRKVRVRIKAETVVEDRAVAQVLDNTHDGALYAMESDVVDDAAEPVHLHAASGWVIDRYALPRTAAPYAILDTLHSARQAVLRVDPSAPLPLLVAFWSVDNRADALFDPPQGLLRATEFRAESGGPRIYVQGVPMGAGGEYDDSLIAHEWAHYYQWSLSRDDSLGGFRGDEPLELTVAFSEGWADAWAAIVTGKSDLVRGGGEAAGWFSARSIGHILWTLMAGGEFEAIHSAMRSIKEAPSFIGIHTLSAALRALRPALADVLDPLLLQERILPSAVTDPWGHGERLDGRLGLPLGFMPASPPSIHHLLEVDAPPLRVCASSRYGSENKHGMHAYLRLRVGQAGGYVLRLQGVSIQDAGGRTLQGRWPIPTATGLVGGRRVLLATSAQRTQEVRIDLPEGEFSFSVSDWHLTQGLVPGGVSCLDASLRGA